MNQNVKEGVVVGIITFVIVSLAVLMWVGIFRELLMPEDFKNLATKAYVDEQVKGEEDKYSGAYCYAKGEKYNCKYLESHEGFVKVEFLTGAWKHEEGRLYGIWPRFYFEDAKWVKDGKYVEREVAQVWIPRSDYHEYRTLNEISEYIDKMEGENKEKVEWVTYKQLNSLVEDLKNEGKKQ